MVDFRPFKALRFNTTQKEQLSDLICPPYDVISEQEQSHLYSLSNHNAVRLELPIVDMNSLEEQYEVVRTKLDHWLNGNVLTRDSSESFYITRHQFSYNGNSYNRHGITGCIRLDSSSNNRIITHEHTAPKPRHDRLVHLQCTQANISPIMGLYRDKDSTLTDLMLRVSQNNPCSHAKLSDNEEIIVWKIDKVTDLSMIQSIFESRKVHLADGHHRYGAMLQYQKLAQKTPIQSNLDQASNFIMITLIPFDDPGLLLLPYHRLLQNISPEVQYQLDCNIENNFQAVSVVPLDPGSVEHSVKIVNELLRISNNDGIVQIQEMKATLLEPNQSSKSLEPTLDQNNRVVTTTLSWILNESVLKPALGSRYDATLRYEHEIALIIDAIFKKSSDLGFIMKPLTLTTFEQLHQATLILPPKSTFFHPKLPAGLTMRELR